MSRIDSGCKRISFKLTSYGVVGIGRNGFFRYINVSPDTENTTNMEYKLIWTDQKELVSTYYDKDSLKSACEYAVNLAQTKEYEHLQIIPGTITIADIETVWEYETKLVDSNSPNLSHPFDSKILKEIRQSINVYDAVDNNRTSSATKPYEYKGGATFA